MSANKNSKRINITIPEKLYMEAKKYSQSEGKTFSGIVQELLQLYLAKSKQEERKYL